MEPNSDGSKVMGAEASQVAASLTDKIPPSYDDHSSYELYRPDVELWLRLIHSEPSKQGPVLIACRAGNRSHQQSHPGRRYLLQLTVQAVSLHV